MFFLSLSEDEIRNIAKFLTFNEVLKFSYTNSLCNSAIDNIFYDKLAKSLYGNVFWEKAMCRPILVSTPFFNYKKELLRIEKFQSSLDRINMNRWTNNDFYNYWQLDNERLFYILKKNKFFINIFY